MKSTIFKFQRGQWPRQNGFSRFMTPLKRFPRGHWPRWNSYDPSEIQNRRNRSFGQTPFFRGDIPQNYREISPYHILTLKKKLISGILDLHFRWNRFWWFSKRLSRRIRSHMRNGFCPRIRALGVVDLWKKIEGRESRATVPLRIRNSLTFRVGPHLDPTKSDGNTDGNNVYVYNCHLG
jgi:hypothetical protein